MDAQANNSSFLFFATQSFLFPSIMHMHTGKGKSITADLYANEAGKRERDSMQAAEKEGKGSVEDRGSSQPASK